jgi:hypothetical protein
MLAGGLTHAQRVGAEGVTQRIATGAGVPVAAQCLDRAQ